MTEPTEYEKEIAHVTANRRETWDFILIIAVVLLAGFTVGVILDILRMRFS